MDIKKNKEFEDFLKYGMTQIISKHELVEGNFLLLFFTLIAMTVSQFSIVVCVIGVLNLILGCVLTYSKQEIIKGKKTFGFMAYSRQLLHLYSP